MYSLVDNYEIFIDGETTILPKACLVEDSDITVLDLEPLFGITNESHRILNLICYDYNNSIVTTVVNKDGKINSYVRDSSTDKEDFQKKFSEFLNKYNYSIVIKNCKKLCHIYQSGLTYPPFYPNNIYIVDCINLNYNVLIRTIDNFKQQCPYTDLSYAPDFFKVWQLNNNYPSLCIIENGEHINCKLYDLANIVKLQTKEITELKKQLVETQKLVKTLMNNVRFSY